MELKNISPEFAKAIVKAQGEIEGAKKGKENTFFKDVKGRAAKYADLSACWDACRDALQANNLAVVQFPTTADAGRVGITGGLVYGPTGECLLETLSVPVKDATNPQAMGSAITYGRRYQLCAIIGICPEDDDGNAAAQAPKQPKATEPKPPPINQSMVWDTFSKELQSSVDQAKTYYSQVKAMALPEETKTALLSKMVAAIRAAQGAK